MKTPLPVSRRVAELVAHHGLPPDTVDRFVALLDLVASDPHAPTSVTDRARAVDVHLADSLTALELAVVRRAERVADLGSGAGFPGIALAVALPAAQISLVESIARKCAFLERARAAARLENVSLVCARAESWVEGRGAQDLVTARALGPLSLLCEYAAPLLRVGGVLVAWKGRVEEAERRGAESAAELLGLTGAGVVRTTPYPGSAAHQLHMYAKTSDTPDRFPRRSGMARKHPLGRER